MLPTFEGIFLQFPDILSWVVKNKLFVQFSFKFRLRPFLALDTASPFQDNDGKKQDENGSI